MQKGVCVLPVFLKELLNLPLRIFHPIDNTRLNILSTGKAGIEYWRFTNAVLHHCSFCDIKKPALTGFQITINGT